jgi:hypothetical protein
MRRKKEGLGLSLQGIKCKNEQMYKPLMASWVGGCFARNHKSEIRHLSYKDKIIRQFKAKRKMLQRRMEFLV